MKGSKEETSVKNVGIWIRVSTDEQAEGDSPEHHEKRARFYAESKGWNVVETYQLAGVSGKSVKAHPETKRMLEDLSSGKITGLIFSKLARLARNTRELLDFADIFQEHGADLVSLQEAIDTSTPAGRLFYTMIAAMAQWEREEITSRVVASIPIRAKLGKSLGGAPPFGYTKDKESKRIVIDPVEGPIRRQIFELFLKHKRFRLVARHLNDAGYRLREGGLFHGNAVQRYLTDPIVRGSKRTNYTKTVAGKVSLKPESEWFSQEVEPLVTEEIWNQCQALIASQRRSIAPAKRAAAHLFSGLVLCTCGTKMYVKWGTDKYVCLKCRNKIPIVDLEDVFHEQLKQFVLSPAEIVKYLSQTDENIQQREQLLKSLDSEQAKVKTEMQKLYRLYMEDGITSTGFRGQYRPLEDRLAQLNDQIPAIQGEMDFLKIQHLSGDQVVSDIHDLYTHWPNLAQEEKRAVIEAIVDEIIIGKDDVTIHLGYVPPPAENLSARIVESTHAAELKAHTSLSELVGKMRQNLRVLSQFTQIILTAAKPNMPVTPNPFNTIGDHILHRRKKLGLRQKDIAAILKVERSTVINWETRHESPRVCLIPSIIEFLGYVPYSVPQSFGEWLTQCRVSQGKTREELSRELGFDDETIGNWETGRTRVRKGARLAVARYFGSLPQALFEKRL